MFDDSKFKRIIILVLGFDTLGSELKTMGKSIPHQLSEEN
jgi:hypothetical protein